MTKFERGRYPFQDLTPEEQRTEAARLVVLGGQVPCEEAIRFVTDKLTAEVWLNDKYQVAIRKSFDGSPLVHLSIKRLDRDPIHDWRDLQRIKNELVGPECEAVELYPADSRLVDAANQFHLWAHPSPEFRFPVGFKNRMVATDAEAAVMGAKQRPVAETDVDALIRELADALRKMLDVQSLRRHPLGAPDEGIAYQAAEAASKARAALAKAGLK